LSVTAGGAGVVPVAGSVAVRLLADRVGLTDRLSTALAHEVVSSLVMTAGRSGWMWR
jgi:hypothetical protein